jgi:MFS transporter, PAT family, beta-lactamase induction signal transducer AmpG
LSARPTRERNAVFRLALLGALYVVQGLPLGFQANALSTLLRRQGTSLEAIGFATALAAPWMLKLLLGPTVDAYWSQRIGRRKTWILPLQVGLALVAAIASTIDPARSLGLLMWLLLLMNVFAAALDVPVDGLALDLLRSDELGPGNAVQVVGFKLGMIASGGLLFSQVQHIGYQGLFAGMSIIVSIVLALTIAFLREPDAGETKREHVRIREVFALLWKTSKVRGTIWVLLFIATYKIGESAADRAFQTFLVDRGYLEEQMGLWLGTYGMIASIAGSIAGGALARWLPLVAAVGIAASLRAIPIGAQWWLSIDGPTDARVIAITVLEHFFGGALTTSMFAFMMSRVDHRIAATHYTALATVEMFGKFPGGFLSGVFSKWWGYDGVFGAAFALSIAFLGLLIPIQRLRSDPSATEGPR